MTVAWLAMRAEPLLDLAVYRAGAHRLLDGASVYAHTPGDLPFTYPPFAALTFVPLALLPGWLAELAVPLASCVALAAILWRCGVRSLWLMVLVPAATVLEPVWATQHFGQVNLVLTALVVVDLVGPTSRWRGVLTGVAAGIKLTPLVFLGYLVVTRQWRAAVAMTLTFAASVLVPVVLLPDDGVRFWTSVLPDAGRIGAPWFAANQSLMGVLARLGGEGDWVRPGWFVLSAVVVLAALWLARRSYAAGDSLAAVAVMGLASLLASPVSWSHHWVWCLPLGVVLLRHTNRGVALVWGAAFVLAPHLWLPRGDDLELAWTWQHLPGNANIWAGLVWLVLMTPRVRPLRPVRG